MFNKFLPQYLFGRSVNPPTERHFLFATGHRCGLVPVNPFSPTGQSRESRTAAQKLVLLKIHGRAEGKQSCQNGQG